MKRPETIAPQPDSPRAAQHPLGVTYCQLEARLLAQPGDEAAQITESLIELGDRIRNESGFAQQEPAIKEQLEQLEALLLPWPDAKL